MIAAVTSVCQTTLVVIAEADSLVLVKIQNDTVSREESYCFKEKY